jgi:hypothetical protein
VNFSGPNVPLDLIVSLTDGSFLNASNASSLSYSKSTTRPSSPATLNSCAPRLPWRPLASAPAVENTPMNRSSCSILTLPSMWTICAPFRCADVL